MIGLRRAHTQSQQEAPNACSAESTNHPGIVAGYSSIPTWEMLRQDILDVTHHARPIFSGQNLNPGQDTREYSARA
jgi:hypothetical protein